MIFNKIYYLTLINIVIDPFYKEDLLYIYLKYIIGRYKV